MCSAKSSPPGHPTVPPPSSLCPFFLAPSLFSLPSFFWRALISGGDEKEGEEEQKEEKRRAEERGSGRFQLIYFVHFLPVQSISTGVSLVSYRHSRTRNARPSQARCRYNEEERRVSREFVRRFFLETFATRYTRVRRL